MSDRRLFLRWALATWAGWLLGVPFIAALALMGEAVGIGGSQVLVGAGMGLGIGLMQARIVRRWLRRWTPWLASCVVGLALPFLAFDLSKLVGRELPYNLLVLVTLGGLIVGTWQALLLRERFSGTVSWVAASGLGWMLAAATSSVADHLTRSAGIRGIWGALAYLAIITSGGLLLGLVTGAWLGWKIPREPRP